MTALLVLSACSPASRCGPPQGRVARVIDGDTLVLESGVKVRLLLVDTPEITKGQHECYGTEAAAFTAAQVSGREVELGYDEAACTDRYGRTLAYVSVDGVELNSQLLEGGFACLLFIPPGGEARRTALATLEAEARRAGAGLWGRCSPSPCAR